MAELNSKEQAGGFLLSNMSGRPGFGRGLGSCLCYYSLLIVFLEYTRPVLSPVLYHPHMCSSRISFCMNLLLLLHESPSLRCKVYILHHHCDGFIHPSIHQCRYKDCLRRSRFHLGRQQKAPLVIPKASRKSSGDRYCSRFFASMVFGVFLWRSSKRL